METAVDPGKEILQRIAALEVERARIEAETTSLMLDFQDLRHRESQR